MKRFLFIISTILVLFVVESCSSKRSSSTHTEPPPEWVQRKPQSPHYYIGVSSASKHGATPDEYIQSAQQRALGDLAASISVNIESSSFFTVMETNNLIYENYSRDILASTSKELEGYELVDSWEDNSNYWVYYRLSRDKYHRIREQRKEQAINNAKNKYQRAQSMLERGSHFNAFKFYVEAMEDLKLYLGESTKTNFNDEVIDFGTFMYNEIADFLSNLNIHHNNNKITVKRGIDVNPELLKFHILDKNDKPVADIPLRISFTGSGLLRGSATSGADGSFIVDMRRVGSHSGSETLRLTIDMQNLSRVSSDQVIRDIINNMPAPNSHLIIKLEKPKLFISSTEKSLDRTRGSNDLKEVLKANIRNFYDFTSNRNDADFIVDMTTNTSRKGTYINEYYVTMSIEVTMNDKSGNNVLRRNLSNDHMGSSYENASENAYRESLRTIERRLVRDLINVVN